MRISAHGGPPARGLPTAQGLQRRGTPRAAGQDGRLRRHLRKGGAAVHHQYPARGTQQETEETLIHEWAHMMDWRPYHPLSGDHGPTWGVWYASVFSSYCGVK